MQQNTNSKDREWEQLAVNKLMVNKIAVNKLAVNKKIVLPVTGASISIIVFSDLSKAAPSFMIFNAADSSMRPAIKKIKINKINNLDLTARTLGVYSLYKKFQTSH